MKVKRFFAPTMRRALDQVRDEFGAEAVILSNRKNDTGIEIVAGIDPGQKSIPKKQKRQEKLDWFEDPAIGELKSEMAAIKDLLSDHLSDFLYAEKKRLHPIETSVRLKILQWGFSKKMSKIITGAIADTGSLDASIEHARVWIKEHTKIHENFLEKEEGIFVFLGQSGSGKTSALLQLAMSLAIQYSEKEIAFISTDHEKISHVDPIRHYARVINCPVHVVGNEKELQESIESFYDKRFIFIDTPSLSKCDWLFEKQKKMLDDLSAMVDKKIEKIMVIDCKNHYENNRHLMELYAPWGVSSCVLTKLDETQRIGDALAAIIENKLAVAFFTMGKKIPEHFLLPNMVWVVKKFLGAIEPWDPEGIPDEIEAVDLIEGECT